MFNNMNTSSKCIINKSLRKTSRQTYMCWCIVNLSENGEVTL